MNNLAIKIPERLNEALAGPTDLASNPRHLSNFGRR